MDDDDLPLYAPSKLSSQKRLGKECPYLDTVSRQVKQQTFMTAGCQPAHISLRSLRMISKACSDWMAAAGSGL